MCGRYRLARKKEILAETFDVEETAVEWSPRYNVAPGQDVVVVRQDVVRPTRSIPLVRWGLIPSWSKDAKAGYKMINARAETVAQLPAFHDPFRSRRCLIPADGFYEWSKGGKEKTPFLFSILRWNLGSMEEPKQRVDGNLFHYHHVSEYIALRHSRPHACNPEAR